MFTFADQVDAMNEALSIERAEDRAEGEKSGENKLAALITRLFSLGRESDVERAASDEQFRAKLFKELHIL